MQYYFDALKTLYPSHEDSISKIKESTVKDFRRLQHNVSTYNAAIKDELENLLPIEDRQPDWRRMVASVENAIKEHTSEFAVALLKTYKNTSLIKSEMIVHDLIKSPIPHLEIHSHPIHKVVKLSFQPYFMEFLEKDIDLRWEDCHDKVSIDYSSISVVLGHIWNNAIKYACKNTSIYIKFDTNIHFVKVYISMTSLYVENDERSFIYDEGYSGKWAKITKLGGHGIGMHYIKRLTEMNKGQFDVNFGDTKTFYNAIPYTENTFILILPKAN